MSGRRVSQTPAGEDKKARGKISRNKGAGRLVRKDRDMGQRDKPEIKNKAGFD